MASVFFLPNHASAVSCTNRTIANGGGNWSSTGTWVEGSVPTAANCVVATGTSGNVTIDVNAFARSIDLTGYTGTLTHNAGVTLSIGDATADPSNNALIFPSSGWTYTLGSAITSEIHFVSTSATALNVNFGGKTSGNTFFDGAGGSWKLIGSMTLGTSSILGLVRGTLDTNGYSITTGIFDSSNSNTRSLDLSVSLPSITVTGAVWNLATTTNLTFNAGSSVIMLTGANATFAGGGLTYNSVILSGSGSATVTGANTFVSNFSRSGTAIKTDSLILGASQTISGGSANLTLAGNSTNERLLVTSDILGTTRTITNSGFFTSISNVDFRDITGAGTQSWDLSGITGKSGDCGGNSGITFTTPATQTWQGTTGGTWSNSLAWTTRAPLPQDDVVISSAFIASQTITADMPRLGKSIDWTGSTGSPTFAINSTPNTVYGSLTLISGMTLTTGQLTIFEGRSSYTFTSAGKTFGAITQQMVAGTLTLQDDLTTGSGDTLTLSHGTLSANNHNITMGKFSSSNSNTRAITMGSGTWDLKSTGAQTVWDMATSTNATVTANTSTIKISGSTANIRTFSGGSKTYNNFWFTNATSSGEVDIAGSNTFNDFKVDSQPQTVKFTAGITTTVTTFTVSGSSGNLITIDSTTTGTHNLIKAGGGTISRDYLSIQHSVATPTTTWYAGTHSTDNQATSTAGSGWYFSDAPTPSSISGTVYTDEGTTTMGSGRTVSVSINGAAVGTSNTTASNGTYTLSSLIVSPGDVLTVYLDGNTEKGVTVTVGSGSNLTGINIYQNDLITRCDNSCSLSNANLNTANNNGDTDIDAIYTGTTTITTASGKSLYIPASHTFAPANPIVVAGNFTNNGGFTHGSSTVTLTGTGAQTFTPRDPLHLVSSPYYNLVINGFGGTYTLQDALTVSNDLTITAGTLDTKSGSDFAISVGNTWSNSGTFTARNGTVTLNGTDQAIAGTTTFYNLTKQETTNNSTNKTLTFTSGTTTTISNNLTLDGLDSNDKLLIRATAASAATIDFTGSSTFSTTGFLDVQYSTVTDNSSGVALPLNPANSTDSGNTTGWFVSGSPTFDQKHFRFYQDNASLNSADPYANEDTNYNIGLSTTFRVRIEVANTGTASGSLTARLEFKENSGSWTQITTGTNNVRLSDSSQFPDSGMTTSHLTATGSFTTGYGKDTSSDATNLSLTNGNYTEYEYALILQPGAAGNSYQFRLTNTGTPLDTYTVTPTINSPDSTPPVPSGFNPANSATIKTATPNITFNLDEAGDCKASTTNASYAAMSGANCTKDGSTSAACLMPSLGSNGSKTIYFACQDVWGNQDTSGTTHSVTYTLSASDSLTAIMNIKGTGKIKGVGKVR